jgi:hypothetical protein
VSSLLASAAAAGQGRRRDWWRRGIVRILNVEAGGIGGGFLLCVITFVNPRGLRRRLPLGFFYVRNPCLLFIFFRTLSPPRLYVISLLYICIWNPFLFYIFIHTFPPPTTMGAVSYETTDESTKRLSHKKKCHLLFFLVGEGICILLVVGDMIRFLRTSK